MPYSALQIDLPVEFLDEVNALEPPVPKELGVEGSHDQLASLQPHRCTDAAEQLGEVLGVTQHLLAGELRLVCELGAEPRGLRRHAPHLEAARLPNFMELEIRPIAGIPAVA